MRRVLLAIMLVSMLAVPVSALDITAPTVPESGRDLMPRDHETFGQGLLEVLKDALGYFRPDLKEAAEVCCCVTAAVMAVSVFQSLQGMGSKSADAAGACAVAALLLNSAHCMIRLGLQTIREVCEYGKLLLPAMTAALAAQGGVTTSAALYAATAFFDSVLTGLISKLLTPMLYFFLALAVAGSAVGAQMVTKLRDTVKWAMTWVLKILLYAFTGYISITGVVSGGADASALKAAKLTISTVVPVVGNILSDASEAVLVSAGTVKNAAGIYGLLAVIAVCAGPFLRIGVHYLMLKLTGGICGIFGSKRVVDLILDFSAGMGLVLAMTGAACLMLMISTVCFLKGVG